MIVSTPAEDDARKIAREGGYRKDGAPYDSHTFKNKGDI